VADAKPVRATVVSASSSVAPKSTHELRVEIVSATELGAPEYRVGDQTAGFLTGNGSNANRLEAVYVELELGNEKIRGKSGATDSNRRRAAFVERHLIPFSGMPVLVCKVRDRRRVQAMLRGDPLIGEGCVLVGAEAFDGRSRSEEVSLQRAGVSVGILTIRYQVLEILPKQPKQQQLQLPQQDQMQLPHKQLSEKDVALQQAISQQLAQPGTAKDLELRQKISEQLASDFIRQQKISEQLASPPKDLSYLQKPYLEPADRQQRISEQLASPPQDLSYIQKPYLEPADRHRRDESKQDFAITEESACPPAFHQGERKIMEQLAFPPAFDNGAGPYPISLGAGYYSSRTSSSPNGSLNWRDPGASGYSGASGSPDHSGHWNVSGNWKDPGASPSPYSSGQYKDPGGLNSPNMAPVCEDGGTGSSTSLAAYADHQPLRYASSTAATDASGPGKGVGLPGPVKGKGNNVGELVLGKGSWASAYRAAAGARRDSLRLLFSSGIVTALELSDDLTIISDEHISECIDIADGMLRHSKYEAWITHPVEAKKHFEEQLTAMYNDRFGAVM